MSEIVNLRQARKAKTRKEAEVLAAERRVLFGRSKVERVSEKAVKHRAERQLDGHRLDQVRKADE